MSSLHAPPPPGEVRSGAPPPPPDRDRWIRIKSIFLESLDHPEPERASFVAEACGSDPGLCEEVLSLLESDRAAGSFCEEPAAALLRDDAAPERSAPRLAPGARLGAYEITEFLGAGGMGEVYRGSHTVLERPVAIKTVGAVADADARRRLLREARNAALLKHPNICTIHEVGESEGTPYLVMELIDGRPLGDLLRESELPLSAALGYALEISDALAHAHERGVVHRDLKSSNVVIDGTGRAVVLDFGLAKRLTPESPGGESITGVGRLVGTLSHMAPEVLLGGGADCRSDVWSLGVLLFELATGRLPFRGSTPFDTSAAILDGTVDWPERRLPLALRLVIERCLAREPEDRYQEGAEVRDAIEGIRRRRTWRLSVRLLLSLRRRALGRMAALLLLIAGAAVLVPWLVDTGGLGGPPPISTLAVLPLENTTDDPRLDYYAAGLSEALLSSVGAALDLRVVSDGDGSPDGEGGRDPAVAGRSLGAQAVVTGRLRSASDRVALDVRLIDASTGRVLWSDTFERTAEQVLVLESDVIRGLAAAVRLAVRPGAEERLTTVRAVSPAAYEAFLKGRYEWNRRTPESLDRALEHFSRARDLDPTYAPAHAALADVYNQFATVLVARGSPLLYRPQAEAAAIRALQIDPYSAEAHAALGYVQHYDGRWADAEASFRRAMELNPSYPMAHLWHANLQMSRGRMEEALEHAEMARALDPFSLIVNANIGWILVAAGRAEEALRHLEWTLRIDSTYVQARVRLVGALRRLGRSDEALEQARRLVEMDGGPFMSSQLASLEVERGDSAEARRLLAGLLDRTAREYVPPACIAEVYGALGETEAAVEWLVRSFQERSNAVAYFRLRPELGGVHADPRIQALASKRGAN